MGGFSSSSYIMLTRDNQQPDGSGITHHGNQLLVCIHNKVRPPHQPSLISSAVYTSLVFSCIARARACCCTSPKLCAVLQMDFASKAREVVIFCPYWIINKTNLTLKLKDNTPVSSLPPKAAPGLGGVAQPILFG